MGEYEINHHWAVGPNGPRPQEQREQREFSDIGQALAEVMALDPRSAKAELRQEDARRELAVKRSLIWRRNWSPDHIRWQS